MALHRKLSGDEIVEYLHKVYDVNKTALLNQYGEYIKLNSNTSSIYTKFYTDNPIESKDDKTRKYFNKIGKTYFYRFFPLNFDDSKCMISGRECGNGDVHHIFPLVYGGDNSLENLVHINPFAHGLLHENPAEDRWNYSNIAYDHLMLIYRGYSYFWIRDALNESNGNEILAAKKYLDKVQYKMYEYYNEFFI